VPKEHEVVRFNCGMKYFCLWALKLTIDLDVKTGEGLLGQ
jgi:hypothetical protein